MKISTPKDIRKNNQGIFIFEVSSRDVDKYLVNDLDLREFKDFVIITNQTIKGGLPIKVLHFVSQKGFARFAASGNKFKVWKQSVPDMKQMKYSLWQSEADYEIQKQEEFRDRIIENMDDYATEYNADEATELTEIDERIRKLKYHR